MKLIHVLLLTFGILFLVACANEALVEKRDYTINITNTSGVSLDSIVVFRKINATVDTLHYNINATVDSSNQITVSFEIPVDESIDVDVAWVCYSHGIPVLIKEYSAGSSLGELRTSINPPAIELLKEYQLILSNGNDESIDEQSRVLDSLFVAYILNNNDSQSRAMYGTYTQRLDNDNAYFITTLQDTLIGRGDADPLQTLEIKLGLSIELVRGYVATYYDTVVVAGSESSNTSSSVFRSILSSSSFSGGKPISQIVLSSSENVTTGSSLADTMSSNTGTINASSSSEVVVSSSSVAVTTSSSIGVALTSSSEAVNASSSIGAVSSSSSVAINISSSFGIGQSSSSENDMVVVSFQSLGNGMVTSDDVSLVYGVSTEITGVEVNALDGYQFENWIPNTEECVVDNEVPLFITCNKNSVVKVKFEKRSYQITLDKTGGCGVISNPQFAYTVGSGAVLLGVSIGNYCEVTSVVSEDLEIIKNASGYFVSGIKEDKFNPIGDVFNITFNFNVISVPQVVVSFNCMLGEAIESCSSLSESVYTSITITETDGPHSVSVVEKTGYDFVGLSSGDNIQINGTDLQYLSSGIENVVVHFTREEYTINVLTDGNGSVDESNVKIEYQETTSFSGVNQKALSGYAFDRWDVSTQCSLNADAPLTLTCTGNGTVTAHFNQIDVTGITFAQDTTLLLLGESKIVHANIVPAEALIQGIVYSSSNTNVVTVDAATGELTTVAYGTSIITATSDQLNFIASNTVYVGFVDTRNVPDTFYKAVQIGTQIWMGENLNYDVGGNSICHNNDEEQCTIYGRLYDWTTAMVIDPVFGDDRWSGDEYNHQGICPAGWRIPRKQDWDDLADYVDSENGNEDIGTSLKANSALWTVNTGTDRFGFTALPTGRNDATGVPFFLGKRSDWWTTSQVASAYTDGLVWGRMVEHDTGELGENEGDKYDYHPLRCIKQ